MGWEIKKPSQRITVGPGRSKDSDSTILTLTTLNGFIVAGGAYLDFINIKNMKDKRRIDFDGHTVTNCDASLEDRVVWCGLANGVLVSVGLDGKIKSSVKIHNDPITFRGFKFEVQRLT